MKRELLFGVNQKFQFPKKRMSLQKDMSFRAACVLMSEGNKELYTFLQMCCQVDRQLILILDSMNMRGAQIWAAFAGYSGGFFPHFRECVTSRNEEMIAYVNQIVPQATAVKNNGHIR
jgi:hypothetical protein